MFIPITNMSETEFRLFIAERRAARTTKIYRTLKSAPETITVDKIARDLGLDKGEILKRLEKVLKND